MRSLLKGVPVAERRDTWTAFTLLFCLIASHAILETARDALFLASIPASRLPWVYVAIAAGSLAVTQLQARFGRHLNRRFALTLWIAIASVITLLFWLVLEALGPIGVYALYIWSGLLTTLVLIHFWTLLASAFSITQAKRVYSIIGTGSVLGAIVGSAIAGLLSRHVEPRYLILAAAVGFALTSMVPYWLRDPGAAPGDGADGGEGASDAAEEQAGIFAAAVYVIRQPYARRVGLFVIISTAALTVADYLFKSTVARYIDAASLGTFFASVYTGLNILALAAQIFLVRFILRRFDLSTALSVLPAFLFLGGLSMLGAGGVSAAVAIKAADGGLKHSLHRTATELLFVPLAESARQRVKIFIDVVGQRGGQTLASLLILAATGLGAGPGLFALALVALTLIWLCSTFDLRSHYLSLLRSRLDRGLAVGAFPDLDVASLETLIATLSSHNDDEVNAALNVLEREGRAHLIPALILFHPNPEVVRRALDIFIRARRVDIVPHLDRLIEQPQWMNEVRSAVVAARSALAMDERWLRMRLSEEDSAEVRATIMVNLIASGAIVGSDARDALESLLAHGQDSSKIALAEAIARRSAEQFDDVLLRLCREGSPKVVQAAMRAMANTAHDNLMPELISLLGREDARRAAAIALREAGEAGFAALCRALEDDDLPLAVRWHLPRTIGKFDAQRAADAMLSRLPHETNGLTRYRLIRTLENLVHAHPTLALDRDAIEETIRSNVARAYRYLDRLLTLESGARDEPARVTDGHLLLVKSLRDKAHNGVERLFRILDLADPAQEFFEIYRGLQSSDRAVRSSSLELIETLLEPPLRQAVMGLVDDVPESERLQFGAEYHQPLRLNYEGLLDHMLDSSSEVVQDITAFHIGELRLRGFRRRLRSLAEHGQDRPDVLRALTLIGDTDDGAPSADEMARADDKTGDSAATPAPSSTGDAVDNNRPSREEDVHGAV